MRVLQVGSALFDWGGIERYVAYLTAGLIDRGHEVTVSCPPASPLDERIKTAKITISIRRQIQLSAFRQYLRVFRAQRYDVVHVHFNPDFIVSALAARMARQPSIILTRHVALPWSPVKVRRYTKLFDHIIPVSQAVEQKLLTSGVPGEMMTVAKAGCPALIPTEEAEAARRALAIPAEAFSIGFFGRLVPEKGVLHLVEAIKALPPGCRADVFGEGPQREVLERRAADLGVKQRVRFHGFVPEVANAMSAVDCVVIPSTWDEAFPYAALEAMSIGKPIVASRAGGLPEVVEEGKTGLLAERADSKDLARALKQLAEVPGASASMGAASRAIHAAHYTIPKMAERIEQVYTRVRDRAQATLPIEIDD